MVWNGSSLIELKAIDIAAFHYDQNRILFTVRSVNKDNDYAH